MNIGSTRLTHVAPVFRVSRLERSIAFYRDQLGFELEFVYDDFYASVRREGCHVHLKCAPPPARSAREFEADAHIDAYFGVRNLEVLSAQWATAQLPILVPLRQMPYGKELYVRDPDGYIIAFVESADDDARSTD